jgi:hypothetical protein
MSARPVVARRPALRADHAIVALARTRRRSTICQTTGPQPGSRLDSSKRFAGLGQAGASRLDRPGPVRPAAARAIGADLRDDETVADESTVQAGTALHVDEAIRDGLEPRGAAAPVTAEGAAVAV